MTTLDSPLPDTLDDFSDLDALVAESMEAKLARKTHEAKVAKAKKDKKAPPGSLFTDGNARSFLYESRREWIPAAQVAFYQQQFCTHCQSYNSIFSGIFERQEDKSKVRIDRWVKPELDPVALAKLPKETKVFEENVSQCACCAESQGWGV